LLVEVVGDDCGQKQPGMSQVRCAASRMRGAEKEETKSRAFGESWGGLGDMRVVQTLPVVLDARSLGARPGPLPDRNGALPDLSGREGRSPGVVGSDPVLAPNQARWAMCWMQASFTGTEPCCVRGLTPERRHATIEPCLDSIKMLQMLYDK
jgi:hypothetical protein